MQHTMTHKASDELDWFVTISIGLCTLFIAAIFTDSFRGFHCTKNKLHCNFFTILFYQATCISLFAAFVNILSTGHRHTGLSYYATRCGIICWEIALYLMLCTYAIRIHRTFRHSFLKLSQKTIQFLYFFCISNGISGLCVFICLIFGEWITMRDICVLYSVITYIILSILLMILFIKRIDRVMLGKFEDRHILDDNMVQSMIDNDLINLFVRTALLTSISICSSFIGIFGSTLLNELDSQHQYSSISYFIIILTSTINVLTTYLFSKKQTAKYERFCSIAHRWCEQWKIKRIIKSHENRNQERDLSIVIQQTMANREGNNNSSTITNSQ